MSKFDSSDAVRVSASADEKFRPTEIASVIGVFLVRPAGKHFDSFPAGVVYTIEFEDGEAIDISESLLEPGKVVSEEKTRKGDAQGPLSVPFLAADLALLEPMDVAWLKWKTVKKVRI